MSNIHAQEGVAELPTPRERELISLIALGLQNKAIAFEMKISPHTVRAHIGNIMRKYKLRNRTQIAVILTTANSKGGLAADRGASRQGRKPNAEPSMIRNPAE